jgi:hypothetical protein
MELLSKLLSNTSIVIAENLTEEQVVCVPATHQAPALTSPSLPNLTTCSLEV